MPIMRSTTGGPRMEGLPEIASVEANNVVNDDLLRYAHTHKAEECLLLDFKSFSEHGGCNI
jgi:hypothetical protein